MRKILCFLMCICTMVLFGGCYYKEYPFFNNKEDITYIEIVKVNNSLDYLKIKITLIERIEAKEQFLEDFSEIKCQSIMGYAYAIEEDSLAIKIGYKNGDFELLAVPGPGRIIYSVEEYYLVADLEAYIEQWGDLGKEYHTMAKHYNLHAGTVALDQTQLENLVKKYYNYESLNK